MSPATTLSQTVLFQDEDAQSSSAGSLARVVETNPQDLAALKTEIEAETGETADDVVVSTLGYEAGVYRLKDANMLLDGALLKTIDKNS